MNINITEMIVNTLLVSILEEYLIMHIILALLKEHDYLYKGDIIRNGF